MRIVARLRGAAFKTEHYAGIVELTANRADRCVTSFAAELRAADASMGTAGALIAGARLKPP